MLRIICGPTAAGKSSLAMELAARHGLTIISADSRQIYRDFDIGTAKPTAAERLKVRHVGVDIADPGERWSAWRWANEAAEEIDKLGDDRVLVVGGTGLYMEALVHPMSEQPPVDEARRELIVREVESWPIDRMRAWAEKLDPVRAHLGRTQLMRVIEVALLTGRRLSDLIASVDGKKPDREARWLVVDPGDALQGRISGRIDEMLRQGWVDEARDLAARHPEHAPAWKACGYRVTREIARGEQTLDAGRATILVHTRQYAKRQRTWFRNQITGAHVTRLDPRDPRATNLVRAWWDSEESA